MFSKDLLIVVRTVLAARCPATVCLQTVRGAIRVVNAALWRLAQGNRHVEGAGRSFPFKAALMVSTEAWQRTSR